MTDPGGGQSFPISLPLPYTALRQQRDGSIAISRER